MTELEPGVHRVETGLGLLDITPDRVVAGLVSAGQQAWERVTTAIGDSPTFNRFEIAAERRLAGIVESWISAVE